MSIHTKIDKNGQIIELLATNQDAVLANAAPALLEACELAISYFRSERYATPDTKKDAFERIQAAIAKAKGK